jgi:Trk-type K+ transport system membrane component
MNSMTPRARSTLWALLLALPLAAACAALAVYAAPVVERIWNAIWRLP